jgi:hypothetical protein
MSPKKPSSVSPIIFLESLRLPHFITITIA